MKATFFSLLFTGFVMVWGCGQKSHDHEGHDHASDPVEEEGGNQALEQEIMKVHDEVMPKMDEIYRLKEELKSKLAAAPDLAEEKKKELENTVAELDSASDSMMDWMHKYSPIPDSVEGAEKAREYLENEMEKIRKVKEDMLEAIEKAKAKS
jgi:DNA repair exonuclease SbcCD ATPase subunit